ncbi:MAG: serine/threonine protein kinase [Phycisphaerales bacterium]|nr:serine/threonine protein kinase [Phycisphaerales bacterium]
MTQWHYARAGSQLGPVSSDELAALFGRGELTRSDLVWRDGMPEWRPADQVPELAPYATAGGHPEYAQPGQPQADYAVQGYAQSRYAQPAGYPPQGYAQPGYGAPLGYAQPQSYAGSPVPYAYPGGFWWRFLAYVIDYIVLFIPNMITQFGFNLAVGNGQQQVRPGQVPSTMFFGAIALVFVAQVVINWLYYAIQESSAAQATLGKRACGLVVTDLQGQRIGFGRATGRYFGKILSGLILAIGFIMAAFTERKQALHDMMAGTLVWKKP